MQYNTSEAATIYDAPAPHMTLPALFRYAGIDRIDEHEIEKAKELGFDVFEETA